MPDGTYHHLWLLTCNKISNKCGMRCIEIVKKSDLLTNISGLDTT
jgi:hypothetical protein